MLIALGSWRGSPGVTTSTLALAEAWPGENVYVVECDPRGGTLVARYVLAGTRRLVALAGDARNSGDVALLAEHAVVTPAGVRCLTGPEDGTQLRAALSTLLGDGGVFESVANDPSTVVFADCGRLEPDLPEMAALLLLADQLVLVVRPSAEHALHLSGVRAQVRKLHPNTGLLLAGDGYPAAQVEQLLNLPVLGHLPSITSQPAARYVERVRAGFGPSQFRKAAVGAVEAIMRNAQVSSSEVRAA